MRLLAILAIAASACSRTATPSGGPAGSIASGDSADGTNDPDQDGDGYPASVDCFDTNPAVHPGAPEVCDLLDDDCDGLVDEADDNLQDQGWYDSDGDGVAGTWGATCHAMDAKADCDDSNPAVYPGAAEDPCNGVDDDCDGDGAEPAAAAIGATRYDLVTDALSAAKDGDTIWVCPGVHDEMLVVGEERVVEIEGWSGDPSDTVLTGGGTHRILQIEKGADVSLKALTLQRGEALPLIHGVPIGGALYATEATVAITDCTFDSSHAAFDGGAITIATDWEGDGGVNVLSIQGTTFSNNSADDQGGALHTSGYSPQYGTPTSSVITIANSTFKSNYAYDDGGAIALRARGEESVTMTDSHVLDNISDVGVPFKMGREDSNTTAEFVRTTFEGNQASQPGAALYPYKRADDVEITLDHCVIHSNQTVFTYEPDSTTGYGVVAIPPNTMLTSIHTDWGVGLDDNVYEDLDVLPKQLSNGDLYGGYEYGSLGTDETFTCAYGDECHW